MTKRRIIYFTGGAILFVLLIFIVWLFSTYTFYRIPSEPMVPTAHIGDYIAVNRWMKEPNRGDVIVIRVPQDQDRLYLKRLIGLPGDRIQMIDGILHINGKKVLMEAGEEYFYYNQKGQKVTGRIFFETLPNGASYRILKLYADWSAGPADNTQEFVVPEDHYFLMGDNRDQSMDSRFANVGFIHKKNLVGCVGLITNDR